MIKQEGLIAGLTIWGMTFLARPACRSPSSAKKMAPPASHCATVTTPNLAGMCCGSPALCGSSTALACPLPSGRAGCLRALASRYVPHRYNAAFSCSQGMNSILVRQLTAVGCLPSIACCLVWREQHASSSLCPEAVAFVSPALVRLASITHDSMPFLSNACVWSASQCDRSDVRWVLLL